MSKPEAHNQTKNPTLSLGGLQTQTSNLCSNQIGLLSLSKREPFVQQQKSNPSQPRQMSQPTQHASSQ